MQAKADSSLEIEKLQTGQGKYVPICNHDGILLNDPILLKVDEQCYWLSIADSNIWFWAKAVASERRLDVEVSEPDVSPIISRVPKVTLWHRFSVTGLGTKYFWFRESSIEGIPLVARLDGPNRRT